MFFHRLSLRLSPLRHSMSFLRFIMKKIKRKCGFFCKVAPLVLEVVMSEKQILINCGKNWFEFSKSRTG